MAGIPQNTSYGSSDPYKAPNISSAYLKARQSINQEYASGGRAAAPIVPPAQQPITQSQLPIIPQAGGAWQPTAPAEVNWGPNQQPVEAIPYMQGPVDSSHPQYQAPQVWKNVKTGEQVVSSVPPDYETKPGVDGKYASASSPENLRFRNVPGVGGGQYVVDTTQPGATILSQRAEAPYNYDKDPNKKGVYSSLPTQIQHKTMLGGLDSAGGRDTMGYQIDHIVPLWLGGADTPQNKELLDPITNANKTKIQAVPLTLLTAGKISPEQAKFMALTWRDRDGSIVPQLDNGYLDPSTAQQIYDTWLNQNNETKPASGSWIKDTWNEMKNLKDFGQETFGNNVTGAAIREFAKGTASGATGGYIPYEEDDDYSSGAAKAVGMVSGIAGNAFGFLGGFGAFRAGLGLVAKGFANIGRIGAVADTAANLVSEGSEALKMAEGAGKAADMAKMGYFDEKLAESTMNALINGAEAEKTAAALKRSAFFAKTLKDAGVFGLYGQLTKGGLVNQMVTGDQQDWGKKLFQDTATMGILNKYDNPGVANALKTATGVTLLDMIMNGTNPNYDIRDSLANGVSIGVLHYAGTMNNTNGGTPVREAAVAADSMVKTADVALKQQTGKIDNAVIDAETQKQVDTLMKTINDNKQMQKIIAEQGPEYAIRLFQMRAMALRRQFISSLPESQQGIESAKDILSMTKYFSQKKPAKENMLLLAREVAPEAKTAPINFSTPPAAPVMGINEFRSPVVGTFNPKAPWLNADAKEFASILDGKGPAGVIASRQGFMVLDPEMGKNVKYMQKTTNGDFNANENPENYGRVFTVTYDGSTGQPLKTYEIGTAPREGSNVRMNESNPKLTPYDTSHNIDTFSSMAKDRGVNVIPVTIEYGAPGGELAAADVKTENTTHFTMRIDPNAWGEDAQKATEAWNKLRSAPYQDSVPASEEKALSEANVPISIIQEITDQFQKMMDSNPETFSKNVNKVWGNNTLTPEQAQKIIDNSGFSIGDMITLLRKNSTVWKNAGIYDVVIDDPAKMIKVGSAWNEFQKYPVSKYAPTVTEPVTPVADAEVAKKTDKTPAIKQEEIPLKKPAEEVKKVIAQTPAAQKKVAKAITSFVKSIPKDTTSGDKAMTNYRATDLAKDLHTQFSDIVESKMASRSDLYTAQRADIIAGIKKTLDSVNIPPPKSIEGDTKALRAYKSLQDAVKESVAEEYSLAAQPTPNDPSLIRGNREHSEEELDPLFVKEDYPKIESPFKGNSDFDDMKTDLGVREGLAPNNPKLTDDERKQFYTEKIKKSGGQFYDSMMKLAAKADKDLAEGKPIGTWEGLGLFVREAVPKVYGKYTDGAKYFFGKKVIKDFTTEQTDANGKPKSQSADYVNKRLFLQRAEGRPMSKRERDQLFAVVKEDRNEAPSSGESIPADLGMYLHNVKGARQADEKYDWMTKGEYNMPEIAANLRTGTENVTDGIMAGYNLVRLMIKDRNEWNLSRGKDPIKIDINDLPRKLIKKYDPFEAVRGVNKTFKDRYNIARSEEQETNKNKDNAETKKILSNPKNKGKVVGNDSEMPANASPLQPLTNEEIAKNQDTISRFMLKKKNSPDGKGGPGFLDNMFGGNDVYYDKSNPTVNTPPIPPPDPSPVAKEPMPQKVPQQSTTPSQPAGAYVVRGRTINDNDLDEASKILFAEVSNRPADRRQFEVRNILNTAINRSNSPGPDYGKSLTQVLQRRAQYQGYAPNGMTLSGGKIVPSQYQLITQGKIDAGGQKKYQQIRDAVNEIKSGKFEDTTGGSMFYVHAKDGTMWLGKSLKEAKDNANKHEKAAKLSTTKWGTAVGMPAELATNK